MQAAKWILGHASGFKAHIAVLSLIHFFSALITIVYAVCFKSIIDYATDKNPEMAVKVSLLLILLILVQIGFSFVLGYIDELAKTGLGISIRRSVVSQLLYKNYKELSAYHTGEINNRIFSDVGIVSSNAIALIPSIIDMTVRLCAALVVMFFINKFLGLAFLAAGTVLGACMILFRGKMKSLHKDAQFKEGAVRASVQETVSGALLIKIFHAQSKRVEDLARRQGEYKKAVMRRRVYQSFANSGMSIAYNAGFLFAFFWCIWGIINGFLSYGSLTAVLQLTGQIQGSVSKITGIIPTWYAMTASAERIMELENLPDEKTEAAEFTDINGIEVSHVSFEYDKGEVLSDINFSVKKNEVTAILGISGAGKSTLFMLLLGIYAPKSGTITISSDNGSARAGFATRHLFSYVPQDNRMFSGTIRDNLNMASDAADEEIYRALKIACADFVNAMPDGIDTVVGENGMGLSEGQRQRLAIARAILSKTPVILFDEATSALDEETEKRLIENLSEINKTSILITHRRSVLKICDSAYSMADGEMHRME